MFPSHVEEGINGRGRGSREKGGTVSIAKNRGYLKDRKGHWLWWPMQAQVEVTEARLQWSDHKRRVCLPRPNLKEARAKTAAWAGDRAVKDACFLNWGDLNWFLDLCIPRDTDKEETPVFQVSFFLCKKANHQNTCTKYNWVPKSRIIPLIRPYTWLPIAT